VAGELSRATGLGEMESAECCLRYSEQEEQEPLQNHSNFLSEVTSSNPEQIAFDKKTLQSNDYKVAFRYWVQLGSITMTKHRVLPT